MQLSVLRRLILLVAMVALPVYAFAQEAVLTGTITDSTGAVLPGVTVQAVNEASGNSFESVTDGRGVYRIPARVGNYKISAELSGFNTVVRTGIEVLVGQTRTLNIQMAPSTLQETVTVTGEAPLIETTTSSLGGNIDPRLAGSIIVRDLARAGRPVGPERRGVVGLAPLLADDGCDERLERVGVARADDLLEDVAVVDPHDGVLAVLGDGAGTLAHVPHARGGAGHALPRVERVDDGLHVALVDDVGGAARGDPVLDGSVALDVPLVAGQRVRARDGGGEQQQGRDDGEAHGGPRRERARPCLQRRALVQSGRARVDDGGGGRLPGRGGVTVRRGTT